MTRNENEVCLGDKILPSQKYFQKYTHFKVAIVAVCLSVCPFSFVFIFYEMTPTITKASAMKAYGGKTVLVHLFLFSFVFYFL